MSEVFSFLVRIFKDLQHQPNYILFILMLVALAYIVKVELSKHFELFEKSFDEKIEILDKNFDKKIKSIYDIIKKETELNIESNNINVYKKLNELDNKITVINNEISTIKSQVQWKKKN